MSKIRRKINRKAKNNQNISLNPPLNKVVVKKYENKRQIKALIKLVKSKLIKIKVRQRKIAIKFNKTTIISQTFHQKIKFRLKMMTTVI